MIGQAQFLGLAVACSLLLVIAVVLMAVLARVAHGTSGPRWWGAGAAFSLAGMWLGGVMVRGTVPWERALAVVGGLCLLAGVACVVEGLRRHAGAASARRPLAACLGLVALLLVVAEAAGHPSWAVVATSASAAALWLQVAWTALRHSRAGYHPLFIGTAACALVQAAAWGAQIAVLVAGAGGWPPPRGAPVPASIVAGNGWLVAIAFVATGTLVLLYVLMVNFQLAQQLRTLAVRDPLTGALNRRGFEDRTGRLASLSAQLGQSVTLLMLDIDLFKQVNDRHGHHVGDLVLKALAQLVQRAKRETDVFARLGGEEFCLVLPGTDVPGARVFADRLRRSFETLEIDTGRSFLSCTMSVGVAYASASALARGEIDVVDLLHQADEALYDAKRSGRNRVRFYASPDVLSSRLDSRLFASTSSLPLMGEPTRPLPDAGGLPV